MTIVCGGLAGDESTGACFEAAELLARRGADVLAHSDLLEKVFGEARSNALCEAAADLPPTSIALTENLRKMLDERKLMDDSEGDFCLVFYQANRQNFNLRVKYKINELRL